MSQLIIAQTAEELFEIAGQKLLGIGNDSIAQRGRFVLALSGGSTPKQLHEYLVQPENRSRLDWSKTVFLWGDERSVPPDHEDSNFRMAFETLLEPLSIPEAQYRRMPADAADLQRAARQHQTDIFSLFPNGGLPEIDLVLLGMGDDGHTASLFPHTEALNEQTRWIAANEVPQLDAWRMTMTYPLINAARHLLFLVKGASKADRLREVMHGPLDVARLPSQGICPKDGALTWIVDKPASALLPCL